MAPALIRIQVVLYYNNIPERMFDEVNFQKQNKKQSRQTEANAKKMSSIDSQLVFLYFMHQYCHLNYKSSHHNESRREPMTERRLDKL